MAVKIACREDRQMQTDSNGVTTFTHVMQLEGDSLMEIGTSRLLPQRGSRHPQNTAFYLDSIEITPNGNKNRGVQALATLTYSNGAELVQDFTGDPWDLGAQNFTSNYLPISRPFITGYNSKGEIVMNLNTAGCQITAETTGYIREISFTYCVRARSSGDFEGTEEPIVNKSSERVAGILIPARTGLLLPMGAHFITEREGGGDKIKRQYWEVSATIQINKKGWTKDELNVGTMCYFKDKTTGQVVRKPQAIFSYTPINEKNERQEPKFGSIDDVIEAQETYAKLQMPNFSPKTATMDDWGKFNSLKDQVSYQEVTEPMPLRADGTLYEEAIKDPVTNRYLVVKIYDSKIASWNSYDLPKKRA